MAKSEIKDEKDEKMKKPFRRKTRSTSRGRNDKEVSTEYSRRPSRSGDNHRSSSGVTHSYNDPDWYGKNPIQVEATGNISFLNALGSSIGITDNTAMHPYRGSAGGVMRCGYVPTFGNPQNINDAMNVAAWKLYAQIRQKNSGARNYDAPDLMKYFILMDTVYSYAAFLTRIYGFVNSYSAANRYLPEAIFAAMNVSLSDVRRHIPELRAYIDHYISKANSFAVPSNMPILKRHFWMCSNVYKDSDSPWAQVYVNTPEVYATYNYTNGKVEFKPLTTTPSEQLSYTRLIEIGDRIVNSILTSEDSNIISGDILKAFDGKLFSLSAVPADYALFPVFDPSVLEQIMNSNALGTILTQDDWGSVTASTPIYTIDEITEEGDPNLGALVVRNALNQTRYGEHKGLILFPAPQNNMDLAYIPDYIDTMNDKRYLINKANGKFDPIDIIETTRLAAVADYFDFDIDGAPRVACEVTSCGAEVYTAFTIFYFEYNDTSHALTLANFGPFGSFYTRATMATYDFLNVLQLLAHWDWHPIIYEVVSTNLYGPFVDICRPAVITNANLKNMHETANLSLFDVTVDTSWI